MRLEIPKVEGGALDADQPGSSSPGGFYASILKRRRVRVPTLLTGMYPRGKDEMFASPPAVGSKKTLGP